MEKSGSGQVEIERKKLCGNSKLIRSISKFYSSDAEKILRKRARGAKIKISRVKKLFNTFRIQLEMDKIQSSFWRKLKHVIHKRNCY